MDLNYKKLQYKKPKIRKQDKDCQIYVMCPVRGIDLGGYEKVTPFDGLFSFSFFDFKKFHIYQN